MNRLLTTTDALAADYAKSLVDALLVLGVTAALVYVTLRFLTARGLVSPRARAAQLEQSFRIDGKSNLVIVVVEGRRLLLATHESGPPRLLLELEPKPPKEADA